jgi:hypothetical protein
MDGLFFLQIASAVLAANALTLWWGYSVWRITKVELKTGDPKNAPFIYFIGAAVPPLIMGLGAFFVS